MPDETSPPTEADAAALRARYRPCLIVIPLVLVTLFVQKSDGNTSLETIAFLGVATVSTLAIWSPIAAFGLRGQRHTHRFAWHFRRPWPPIASALLGTMGLLLSMTAIDAEDTDFEVPPSKSEVVLPPGAISLTPSASTPSNKSSFERIHDSESIAIRNIMAVKNDAHLRLTATIINKTEAVTISDQALVSLHAPLKGECTGEIVKYRIDDTLTVRDGLLKDADIAISGGIHDGFTVPAVGQLVHDCGTYLDLGFRVALTLNPQQSIEFAIDVPTHIRAILEKTTTVTPVPAQLYPIDEQSDVDLIFGIPLNSDNYYLDVTLGVGHTSSTNNWACTALVFGRSNKKVHREPCTDSRRSNSNPPVK